MTTMKTTLILTASLFMLMMASPEETIGDRKKRSLGKPLAKVLTKGIEQGVKLGSFHFKALREATAKEATLGIYLTEKFL